MRTVLMPDGRTCVLHGTGIRDYEDGGVPPGVAAPELVQYMLPGLAGQLTLPGDWPAREADALRDLVAHGARHALSGAVPPFDGPQGTAIRDLVIRAAATPRARLRALVLADDARDPARAMVAALLRGDPRRTHAAARLPRYLERAAAVVLAYDDGGDGGDAPGDADRPTPREVADAVLSAATALLVCDRPGQHLHSRQAVAYRALVMPFVQ
jgi:hypothetical protein